MHNINLDQDSYIHHLDTLPDDQAQGLEQFVQECLHDHRLDRLFERGFPFLTATYTDSQGREWRYWPLSAADQMWRDVICNQTPSPATFVGVVDVTGDGTLYYAGSAHGTTPGLGLNVGLR
jgi:hypothetical protein